MRIEAARRMQGIERTLIRQIFDSACKLYSRKGFANQIDGFVRFPKGTEFDGSRKPLEVAQIKPAQISVEFQAAALFRTLGVEIGGEPREDTASKFQRAEKEVGCFEAKCTPFESYPIGG